MQDMEQMMQKMKKLVVQSNKAEEWSVLEEQLLKIQEEQLMALQGAVPS